MEREQIIKGVERGIHYFINRYGIAFQDREDVYQDCLEKIILSLEIYDPNVGVPLNNFLMSRIRGVVKEAKRKECKIPVPVEDMYITMDSLEINVLKGEMAMDIRKGVKGLSEMQYKVIVMKYFYDLSMSEIAVILGIHYSTVAKYHQRGLRQLKKYLHKVW